jgi:hypothetical protein
MIIDITVTGDINIGADIQVRSEEGKLKGALIGRESLLDEMIQWILGPGHEKMWLTIASAGTGKSALHVGLARLLDESKLTPRVVVLYHRICCHSSTRGQAKDIESFLSRFIQSCNDANLEIGDGSYDDLLAVFTVLKTTKPPSDHLIYVLLIDGLDESPAIASLLSEAAIAMVPSWLKIVSTSRNVPNILRAAQCSQVKEYLLDESPTQRSAMAAFITERFPPILLKLHVDATTTTKLIQQLIKHSGIFFIYAQLILNDISDGRIKPTLAAIDGIPRDLNGYYLSSFQRCWPLINGATPPGYVTVRIVLETIFYAWDLGPYSSSVAECMLDSRCDEASIMGILNLLSPFLVEKICPTSPHKHRHLIHKSFADWLISSGPYKICGNQGELRRTVLSYFSPAPATFSLEATPLFRGVLTSLLGSIPRQWRQGSIQRQIDDSFIDSTGEDNSEDGYYTFDILDVPDQSRLSFIYALEAERPENGGNGFWDDRTLQDLAYQTLNGGANWYEWLQHLAVMPERFDVVCIYNTVSLLIAIY